MDATETDFDSETLLQQGEELLDSSRRLLSDIDDALRRDPAGSSAEPAGD